LILKSFARPRGAAAVAAAMAIAAVLAAGTVAATPQRVAAATTQFHGANWADPRDNFATDALVLSGLSAGDSYTTVRSKATAIVSGFQSKLGANTIRIPINPATASTSWWASYQGVVDAAVAKGVKVIIGYWEGPGSNSDGKVDNLTTFWAMWSTVVAKYGSNASVYFEPMNEPHGYSLADWSSLAASWLTKYPSVPKGRVFVDGTGYASNVRGVCADSRLTGTILAIHEYGFWATRTYAGWVSDFTTQLGSCASRTVLDEFGAPMTTGLNYNGSYTSGTAANNNFVAYIQAVTNTVRSKGMGSVVWPGLRNGDSYSMTKVSGSGTALSLSTTNTTGLNRLTWAWGGGSAPTP
jgi:endoglucanase